MLDSKSLEDQLKACIHCGMCLPACPTYVVTGNEGESPRGRLYLINDLIQNQNANQQAIKYLDDCLGCAACQTACPSDVEYISILEHARHEHSLTNYNKGLVAKFRKIIFQYLLANRFLLNLLRKISNFCSPILELLPQHYQKLGINLRASYKAIKTDHYYYATPTSTKTLSLPLGCVMDTLYNSVHWDTIAVLNACGYNVYIPPSNCCGALASHSGEPKLGHKQLNESVEIFLNKPYPVVINSAGCSAFIKEHSKAIQCLELIEILEQAPISLALTEALTATYHPACHLNHQQGLSKNYLNLLERIKGLTLIELPQADLCCGSAGLYNLLKPKLANAIGKLKAENIKLTATTTILTANPGCISQIQAELGLNYRVMHPISLIQAAL